MAELKLDISDLHDHAHAAQELLSFAGDERVFFFEAPMGAGKTTFIKALCQVLGVKDPMSSPTYAIVNEYSTGNNGRVFHFDLYRLRDPEELLGIGFEEYLWSGDYVFIEWPELARPFADKFVRVNIKTEGNNRYIYAEK